MPRRRVGQHPLFTATLADQGLLALLATGQRSLALDAAEQGVHAAVAARDDALRLARSQLKRQLVAVSVAERAHLLAQQEAAAARDAAARARQLAAGGSLKEADVSRIQVLQLQIEQGKDASERSYRQARAGLAQLLGARGAPAEFEVELEALSSVTWPARLHGATQGALAAEALRRRPDLASARAQVEQARAAVAMARRQAIPPVGLQLGHTQQGAHDDSFTPPRWATSPSCGPSPSWRRAAS
jgi:outer membrane protein TolC